MYDSRLISREPVRILMPSVLSIGGFGELGISDESQVVDGHISF